MVDPSEILRPIGNCSLSSELMCNGGLYYGIVIVVTLVMLMFLQYNVDGMEWWHWLVTLGSTAVIAFASRLVKCKVYNKDKDRSSEESVKMGGDESNAKFLKSLECNRANEILCASTKTFYTMIAVVILVVLIIISMYGLFGENMDGISNNALGWMVLTPFLMGAILRKYYWCESYITLKRFAQIVV